MSLMTNFFSKTEEQHFVFHILYEILGPSVALPKMFLKNVSDIMLFLGF